MIKKPSEATNEKWKYEFLVTSKKLLSFQLRFLGKERKQQDNNLLRRKFDQMLLHQFHFHKNLSLYSVCKRSPHWNSLGRKRNYQLELKGQEMNCCSTITTKSSKRPNRKIEERRIDCFSAEIKSDKVCLDIESQASWSHNSNKARLQFITHEVFFLKNCNDGSSDGLLMWIGTSNVRSVSLLVY